MCPSITVDRPALTRFAQQLIRTPSPSMQEGQVAALVAETMREVGFDEVTVDRVGNVIGRIGNPQGRKLLYDAHMDTVGIGDRSAWQRDPFGGELSDGVLYGLGASDMKGGLASMVYAAGALVEAGVALNGALYVVGVVQEEPCEGLAMRHLVEMEGLRPDWVVLGEATNLQIARGQRGRIEMCVVVRGRSCHASAPQRGINAIYEAARLVVSLELLAPQLNNDPFLGKGTIAATAIESHAGSRNVVPDHCTLYIDRRLTVGETETKALAEIRRVLAREGIAGAVEIPTYRAMSYTGYELQGRQYFPFWSTPEDEPLLLTAARTIEDTLGFVPHIGKWDFSTDGVYTAGVAGIPTIGFGPGEERYAHTVDDQVKVADMVAAAQVYAELAVRMLGHS
ncbi:MAG: YgeY family selenium metabolism-linked hydrolase [Chloroflexi bacterium]|nr:YgeY family selenium metabolism-linked hydrolase [Chloroflexota bacterium]